MIKVEDIQLKHEDRKKKQVSSVVQIPNKDEEEESSGEDEISEVEKKYLMNIK
jgi:hypothetical protein